MTHASIGLGGGSPGRVVDTVADDRGDYWFAQAPWASTTARDRVLAGYLDDAERAELATLVATAQGSRALGRIVAKNAVRAWVAGRAGAPIRARDVRIRNDAAGRPHASVAGIEAPGVSLAHCRGTAAAAVAPPGAPVGIDVEAIEPRGSVFARLALTEAELRLGEGLAIDEWVTRAWTVKEAVAKAAGTGLRGRPKDFVVHEVDGDWAWAAGLWVRSAREGDLVVSTVRPR
jgi:phosphopantetheinyl transferase (holo-ACP synthase)